MQRDGHAYHRLEEMLIALSGSFDVVVDDGQRSDVHQLNRSYFGLYVPRSYGGDWRTSRPTPSASSSRHGTMNMTITYTAAPNFSWLPAGREYR